MPPIPATSLPRGGSDTDLSPSRTPAQPAEEDGGLVSPASSLGPLGRFTAFMGLAFLVALGAYAGLTLPSLHDLGLLALVLLASTLLSILVGHLVYRQFWLKRSPRILWTLLGGYALVAALTFLNVFTTARLMFISTEDVRLVAVLLLFGVGIALSHGYLLAMRMSREACRLVAATDRVAEGRFDIRVEPRGRDELAALARGFNEMTKALADAADTQRAVERMRLDLVAWASHDLRTPLTSATVIMEALADGLVSDPQTTERYLQTAKRDLRVLGLLIDDLSLLAQIDAGGLQLARRVGSLGLLVSELADSFSLQARQKGVNLLAETEEGMEPLAFDALQVRRAFTNLLDNAVRHAREGGTVRVQACSNSEGAWIQVWNDGPPIDPSDLPHVFDRFYRSDRSRSRMTGGAGLGLAITKAIVEAHGGQITVESRADHGTHFVLTLPGVPCETGTRGIISRDSSCDHADE
jgi:signal transduction histidine kinase